MKMYLQSNNNQIRVIEMLKERSFHSSVYFNGAIYIIGGLSSGIILNNCEYLQLNNIECLKLPSLKNRQLSSKSIICNNNLYVSEILKENEDCGKICLEYLNLIKEKEEFHIINIEDKIPLIYDYFFFSSNNYLIFSGGIIDDQFNLAIFKFDPQKGFCEKQENEEKVEVRFTSENSFSFYNEKFYFIDSSNKMIFVAYTEEMNIKLKCFCEID